MSKVVQLTGHQSQILIPAPFVKWVIMKSSSDMVPVSILSTLIYSEVRRGIRPSMYALSTVIFVVVLVVLLIANFRNSRKKTNIGDWRI